jgi:hypothetical protein
MDLDLRERVATACRVLGTHDVTQALSDMSVRGFQVQIVSLFAHVGLPNSVFATRPLSR